VQLLPRCRPIWEEDEVDAKVADTLALSVGTLTVGLGTEITTTAQVADAPTAERDLDGYYTRAKRLLLDGSAAWYYNDLCDRGVDEVDAGVRVAALAALGFADVVEKQAVQQIRTWRDANAAAVARMPRAVRKLIEPLWYVGDAAMLPTTVEARVTYPAAPRRFPVEASSRSRRTPRTCMSSRTASRTRGGSRSTPPSRPGRRKCSLPR